MVELGRWLTWRGGHPGRFGCSFTLKYIMYRSAGNLLPGR